jgi:hypothetical protein
VYDLLAQFGLKSKLYCVTTDNATNNDTLTVTLQTRLEIDDAIHFDQSEQHIPCVAHVLNLAVQSFLRNLKVLDDDPDTTSNEDCEPKDIVRNLEKDFAVTMTKIHEIVKVFIFVT